MLLIFLSLIQENYLKSWGKIRSLIDVMMLMLLSLLLLFFVYVIVDVNVVVAVVVDPRNLPLKFC